MLLLHSLGFACKQGGANWSDQVLRSALVALLGMAGWGVLFACVQGLTHVPLELVKPSALRPRKGVRSGIESSRLLQGDPQ